jgi:hypothetical protein
MSRYLLVVPTSPLEGRDRDYNDWYENTHLDEVLTVPGYVAAERFVMVGEAFAGPAPAHKYLAIYEIDAENLDDALKALKERAPRMNLGDSINMETACGVVYKPIGRRHSANSV